MIKCENMLQESVYWTRSIGWIQSIVFLSLGTVSVTFCNVFVQWQALNFSSIRDFSTYVKSIVCFKIIENIFQIFNLVTQKNTNPTCIENIRKNCFFRNPLYAPPSNKHQVIAMHFYFISQYNFVYMAVF